MKTIDRIPRKGELFAYKAGNISKIIIDSKYGRMLINEKINEDLLIGRFLLFMYLGDGLAREKYSSKIFNLVMVDGRDDEDLLNNVPLYSIDYRFLEGYKKSIRNPLVVQTLQGYSEKRIYKVDEDINEKLKENIGFEKQICTLIDKLDSDARNNLINQFDDIKTYNLKKTF